MCDGMVCRCRKNFAVKCAGMPSTWGGNDRLVSWGDCCRWGSWRICYRLCVWCGLRGRNILSIYPRIRGNPRISRVRGKSSKTAEKSSKTREDFFLSRKFLEFVAFSEIPLNSLGSWVSGGFFCFVLLRIYHENQHNAESLDTFLCDSSLQYKI